MNTNNNNPLNNPKLSKNSNMFPINSNKSDIERVNKQNNQVIKIFNH